MDAETPKGVVIHDAPIPGAPPGAPPPKGTPESVVYRLRQRARQVRALCDTAVRMGKPRGSLEIVKMWGEADLDDLAATTIQELQEGHPPAREVPLTDAECTAIADRIAPRTTNLPYYRQLIRAGFDAATRAKGE